jgi:hypothetical protein
MAACVNSNYCITGTGNPLWDDSYSIQGGLHNGYSYFQGITNGYYVFFSVEGYWCLSDTLDGTCFLSGHYPCTTDCPDLCDGFFIVNICLTPTPTPTVNCSVFDFDAIFDCQVAETPTPTPTITNTQTPTPTITTTNFCPFIGVNATIQNIPPTPSVTTTVTPSITPSQFPRDCDFTGEVTFFTINTQISCPISKQFQNCSTGEMYYTADVLQTPYGTTLQPFEVFTSNVDGVYQCITFIGFNQNVIGINVIQLLNGPLGYSNLNDCLSLCAGVPPTPQVTPTPSSTPPPFGLRTCSVIYLSDENGGTESNIYLYDVVTNDSTKLSFTDVIPGYRDIAHTDTKVWIQNENELREWDIVSLPFSSTYIGKMSLPANLTLSDGLVAKDNNTLIGVTSSPQTVVEISVSTGVVNSFTNLFLVPSGREISGDISLTTQGNLIITYVNTSTSQSWITEHEYQTGTLGFVAYEFELSPTITQPEGIFQVGGVTYIVDKQTGLVYSLTNILTSPSLNLVETIGIDVDGISQQSSCLNNLTTVSLYVFRKCPNTNYYIVQTEQSITTTPNRVIYDVANNECWEFLYTTITTPTFLPTDNVLYWTGNYFQSVLSSVYTTCTSCINTNINPPPPPPPVGGRNTIFLHIE